MPTTTNNLDGLTGSPPFYVSHLPGYDIIPMKLGGNRTAVAISLPREGVLVLLDPSVPEKDVPNLIESIAEYLQKGGD